MSEIVIGSSEWLSANFQRKFTQEFLGLRQFLTLSHTCKITEPSGTAVTTISPEIVGERTARGKRAMERLGDMPGNPTEKECTIARLIAVIPAQECRGNVRYLNFKEDYHV